MNKEKAKYWLDYIKPYRSSLDMATIFWYWKSLDEDFDIEQKIYDLGQFMDFNSEVTVLKPRELWGQLLGRCKLQPEYQKSILSPRMPDGIVEEQENISFRVNNENGLELYVDGTDPDRNRFDIRKWNSIYSEIDESDKRYSPYTLKWFAQYRYHMATVTPFSDYHLIKKESHDDLDVRLFFYEEHITPSYEDAIRVGMFNPEVDEFFPFENIDSDGSIYPNEDILFLTKLTHAFIDLDALIEECDNNGYPIPDEFRLPQVSVATEKDVSEYGDIEVANSDRSLPELFVDESSHFPLVKIAQHISEWLIRDVTIQRMLEDKPLKQRKKAVSDYLLGRCKLSKASMDTLLTLLLPKQHRFGASVEIKSELMNVVQLLWSGLGIKDYWMAKGVTLATRKNAVQDLVTKHLGSCGANEAKDMVMLFTPSNVKSTRHYSKDMWDVLRIELLDLDPQLLMK